MAKTSKKEKKCAQCTELAEQLEVKDHQMAVIKDVAEGLRRELSKEDFRYTETFAKVVDLLDKYRAANQEVHEIHALVCIRHSREVSEFLHKHGIQAHQGDYKGALEDLVRKTSEGAVTVHYLSGGGYTVCGRQLATFRVDEYFLQTDEDWDGIHRIARGHGMRAERCQICEDRLRDRKNLDLTIEKRVRHCADFSPREEE